jgi:hypothetical protein
MIESDSVRECLPAKKEVVCGLLLAAEEEKTRTVISVGSRNGLSSIIMLLAELKIPYVTGCEYTTTSSEYGRRTKTYSHTTRGRISENALSQFTNDVSIKVLVLPIGVYDGINIPADTMIALQRAYKDEHMQVTGRIDRLGTSGDIHLPSRKVYTLIHDHWFDKSLNTWQQAWNHQPYDARGFFLLSYVNRYNKNPLAMDGLLTRIGRFICVLVKQPIYDWSLQALPTTGKVGVNQVCHFTLDIKVIPTLSGVIHIIFDTKKTPVIAKFMYYDSVKWCSHEVLDTLVRPVDDELQFTRMQTVLSAYIPS